MRRTSPLETAGRAASTMACVVAMCAAGAASGAPSTITLLGEPDEPVTGALRTGEAFGLSGFGALWVRLAPNAKYALLRVGGAQHHGDQWVLDPAQIGSISVRRTVDLFDPATARFTDRYLNFGDRARALDVVWGGATIKLDDRWRGSHLARVGGERDRRIAVFAMVGPGRSRVALALVGPAAPHLVDPASPQGDAKWPDGDSTMLGVKFHVRLDPGQSIDLVNFALVAAEGSADLDARATRLLDQLPAAPARHSHSVAEPGKRPSAAFSVVGADIGAISTALAAGRTTVSAIAEQYLSRIAAYDGGGSGFHAVLRLAPDVAAQAAAVDRRRAGGVTKPLDGVFLLVKDNIDVEGLPTTLGIPLLAKYPAPQDASVVARLRTEGAIVIGKANLDEIALGGRGWSTAGGQTRNAFDRARAPGGSSAGSAVGVAASLATVALGTDTCGSLSGPAAQAGLVTMRATHGAIDPQGVMPLVPPHDIPGVIARSVDDLARVYAAILGRALPLSGSTGRIAELRDDFAGFPSRREADDQVHSALAARHMPIATSDLPARDLYEAVERVTRFPSDPARIDAYLARLTRGEIASARQLADDAGDAITTRSRATLKAAPLSAGAQARADLDLANAMANLRRTLVGELDRLHAQAFAYPANRVPPMLIGINRYPDTTCKASAYTGLPQVTVRAGRFPGGGAWPIGMSLLGRPDSEADLLRLARALDRPAKQLRVDYPPLAGDEPSQAEPARRRSIRSKY